MPEYKLYACVQCLFSEILSHWQWQEYLSWATERKNITDLNLTEFEFKVRPEDVKRREGKNIFDVKLHARDLNYAVKACFYRMACRLTPRNAFIPRNETLTILNCL